MAGQTRMLCWALLALLAAGAVSARPMQYEPEGHKNKKGKCNGHERITGIRCFTDDDLFLTGLTFIDEYNRESAICDTDGSEPKEIELEEGESIVEIIACKGYAKKDAYNYIQFNTDGSRQPGELFCGNFTFPVENPHPPMPMPKGAASTAGYEPETYKYIDSTNKPDWCVSLSPGYTPKWHKGENPWYEGDEVTASTYKVNGQVLSKSSQVDPMTGQNTAGYHEQPYYSEVRPLGELTGKCNKDDQLYELSASCWNEKYFKRPETCFNTTTIGNPTCPDTPTELEELEQEVQELYEFILAENGVDCTVSEITVICIPSLITNDTIDIDIAFTCSDPQAAQDLRDLLLANGGNICAAPPQPEVQEKCDELGFGQTITEEIPCPDDGNDKPPKYAKKPKYPKRGKHGHNHHNNHGKHPKGGYTHGNGYDP